MHTAPWSLVHLYKLASHKRLYWPAKLNYLRVFRNELRSAGRDIRSHSRTEIRSDRVLRSRNEFRQLHCHTMGSASQCSSIAEQLFH